MVAVQKELLGLGKVFEASILSFIAILAFGIYDFILPLYTENLGEGLAIVGIIISLVYVASLFAEVPIGLLVDRLGRIKVLAVALFSLAALGMVYFFSEGIIQLAVLSLIFGTIAVAFWVPSAVLIRDFSPRKLLSQSEGIYLTLSQLGWIIGPILAGIIGGLFSDKHNFLVFALLVFAAAIFGLSVFRGRSAEKFTAAEGGHKHKARITVLLSTFNEYRGVHKHAIPLYLLSFLAYIWIATEWSFVAIAGIDLGFTAEGAGLLLAAMMAVEGVLYYSSGYLMDKIGKKYIMTAGFFLLFTSTYFIFLATSPAVFIFGLLLAAATVAWILPGTEAMLTEIVPANIMGEMSSVFDTSKDFGLIIGPLAGGILAEFLNTSLAPFIFVSIAAAIATLIAGFVFWPQKKPGVYHRNL